VLDVREADPMMNADQLELVLEVLPGRMERVYLPKRMWVKEGWLEKTEKKRGVKLIKMRENEEKQEEEG